MIFLALGVVALSGFKWRKSNWLSLFIIAFDVILCIGCNDSYDLENLKNMYLYPNVYSEDVAILWDLFFRGCIKIGISWPAFKGICAAITLLFVYNTAKKISQEPNVVLSLYSISLLMFQITQIRSALAFSIVLFGISALIKREKHYLLKFGIFLIISFMMHYSMGFYVLLLFALQKGTSNKKYLLSICVSTAIITVLLGTNALYYIGQWVFPGKQRVLQYLDFGESLAAIDSHSIKSLLILWAAQVIIMLESNMTNKSIERMQQLYNNNQEFLIMHRMQLMTILLVPLYIVSLTYFRLFRNTIVLLYALVSNIPISNSVIQTREKNVSTAIVAISALAVWLLAIYMEGEGFKTLLSFKLGG